MPDPSHQAQPAPFDEARLRQAIESRHAEAAIGDIHILEETSSSNDEASQLALDGAPENTLVIAESQTAGRGRRGNAWSSPARHDLLFSLVLHPPAQLKPEQLGRLPHLIAVAICRAIEEVCPAIEAKIKWPNDVYIHQQKVAGILVENTASSKQGVSIAGIGINVNSLSDDRPDELQSIATSLREESGEPVDRHQLAAAFLANFHQLYPTGLEQFAEILAVIEERSLLLGAKISAQLGDTEITGTVTDFGTNGEMIVAVEKNGETVQQVLNSADRVRLL
ncbi:MAG: biotin--[acetyl-CoA-carboxylase] ligase [Verrucomicrobia bacterium]|nr:biotin--[acetyl-CoA-carboxylase] ligase [Verrucomicrobiota bacterium]